METEHFDADAAFEQAVTDIENGGQPAENAPPVADTHQETDNTPETEPNSPDVEPSDETEEVENALPDWLANATDEVKENFRKLQAENQQLAHRERSQRGRVGALTKKWQQAQAALEKIQQGQTDYRDDLERLSEDYPELADILSRVIDEQAQNLNAISEPMAQVAEANIREMTISRMEDALDYVVRLVPDALDIAKDPQFQAWVIRQPSGIQALWESPDPNNAVYLLSEYKKAASAQLEQRQKRQQQLSAMSLPSGRNTPKGSDDIDEDALFNRYAAELDKQRLQ